ncbi:MAG: EamA family transporter [Flavobacteriales bacterium]|nr:EamA family transporter [Flavobacteriales bacterium]
MGKWQAHVALGVVALIYGANYVIAKGLMPDPIAPRAFILVRVSGALLLFWMVRLFVRETIDRKDLPRFLLCGLTGVATNQILFFEGLNLTSPVNASIIMTINPILVMILAGIILHNPITRRKIAGVLIGAAGAITLIAKSGSQDITASWQGDVLVLLNATSYAIYLVIVKPLLLKYKPITVISWVFLMGLIFVLPAGLGPFLRTSWGSLDSLAWSKVAFVVVATTFMAYLLNIFALKRVQPTVASAYIYLQPIVATIATWLTMPGDHQPFNAVKLLCALFIFVGVWLVSGNPTGRLRVSNRGVQE